MSERKCLQCGQSFETGELAHGHASLSSCRDCLPKLPRPDLQPPIVSPLYDGEVNPFSPPQTPLIAPESEPLYRGPYGGIGRVVFAAILVAFVAAQSIDFGSSGGGGDQSWIFFLLVLLPIYYRLKNIGMNPWWCLVALVPLANLLISIRCLIFQEGYHDTKKLDPGGKVCSGIILAAVLIFTARIFLRV